jgi:glycosyltransferase involved in cell wall biosynthesis/GT2 family glycosyltransferase
MRICLVSREFEPFWGAGIGTYASQMAAAWAARSRGSGTHETHVLCPAYRGLAEQGPRLRPGVRFHGMDLRRGITAWKEETFYPFLRRSLGVYHRLLELHQQHPFDYIEFPEYWAEGYFALRARQTLGHFEGAVLGVRLHTPTYECWALNHEAWLNDEIATLEHAEDESMRLADVLVSPTRSLLEMVQARLGLAAKPAHVVPYPFDSAAAARELGIAPPLGATVSAPSAALVPAGTANGEPRPREVLYFGRIEHRKGVHLLVEAAQQLLDDGLDLRFRFLGRDTPAGIPGQTLLPQVKKQVRARWREHILFEPPRPRNQLGLLIRASALCCFPSLWENFPNTCLEAMSLGAVVVGSDAGGMAEIIEDGISGILFRSGDATDLAAALRRALSDDALRARIAAAAPVRIAALCDPAAVVRAMEQVVEQVRSHRGGEQSPRHEGTGARSEGEPACSVLIPYYNLGAYLPETLDSVRRQTCPDYEIILIDDGSTDSVSLDVVYQVEAGRFGPVRVLRQENAGLAAARNAGLRAARGRWVVPLDADDILHPQFLERTLLAARRDPGLSMVTALVCHFAEEWGDLQSGWIPLGLERDMLPVRNCASCCTALIDRAVLLDLGGYDAWLNPYEDWDLYCRMACRGLRAAVIPEFLIGYRHRGDSMLRRDGPLRRNLVKARLMGRHPGLSLHPDRTLRLQLAAGGEGDSESRARQIIMENIRYRMADRLNDALKAIRMQQRLKALTIRMMRNPSGQ